MMNANDTKKLVKLDCEREIWLDNDDRYCDSFSVLGEFHKLDGCYVLVYDDPVINSIMTLKITEKALTIVSIGEPKAHPVHVRQTHALEEWYAVQYFAANNSLVMRTLTTQLEIDIDEDGGAIELAYELYSGDSCLGLYAMDLYFDL